jgi:hypothetical protein
MVVALAQAGKPEATVRTSPVLPMANLFNEAAAVP